MEISPKNYHEQQKQHEKYQSSKSRSPEYHPHGPYNQQNVIYSSNSTNQQISKPEYDPHATYNQPIELEAPVAGREGGQSEL